jgi:hypothetical protein
MLRVIKRRSNGNLEWDCVLPIRLVNLFLVGLDLDPMEVGEV